MEHGEYATRGALLDLFPMGSEQPYRLDFFDDEIDSLRLFDVESQRTLEEVASINLLPAHEFPTDQAAIELFRSQWRDRFEVKRDAEHIYQQVSKGTLPAGIEYWQPLFFNEPLPPLFSYFPEKTLIVNTGDLEASAERFQNETRARFENRGVDPMRPLLPPEQLWLRSDELFSELKNGRASSSKPSVWRKKPPTPISVIRNYPSWRSRRRTKRRWITCADSSSPSADR